MVFSLHAVFNARCWEGSLMPAYTRITDSIDITVDLIDCGHGSYYIVDFVNHFHM